MDESADQDDLNEDFEPWSTCVNVEGKQIQGTDIVWTKKETYTSKRKREHETHKVHKYVLCHYPQ